MDLEEIEEITDNRELLDSQLHDISDLNESLEKDIPAALKDFVSIDHFVELNLKKPKNLKKELRVSNSDAWEAYGIHPTLLENLRIFEKPTEIQQQTLVHAFSHKDVIGCAQTGSGKTLAFGIPILNYIANRNSHLEKDSQISKDDLEPVSENPLMNSEGSKRNLTALILAPTRELALQVTAHLKEASKNIRSLIVPIVGGMSSQKQQRQISTSPDIIVATPGRLWELLHKDPIFRDRLKTAKYLVIDEADRLLEAGYLFLLIIGHFKHLDNILEIILMSVDESRLIKRQTFIFSATIVDDNLQKQRDGPNKKINAMNKSESFKKLLEKVQFRDKEPVYINLSTDALTADGIMEANIDVIDTKERDISLYYLITRYSGKSIVFVNSIDCIRRLVPILSLLHPYIFPLHAEMQQKQRLKNLERFKANENSVLIATDVAARGLDIPLVDLVIHYQIPRQADTYIHRAGRTARAGAEGVSILLSLPSDQKDLKKLLHVMKKEAFSDFPIDKRLLPALNKRLNLAKQIDAVQHTSKKRKNDSDWFKKAAEDCDIEFSIDEDSDSKHNAEFSESRRLKKLKIELGMIMSTPIIPKGQNLKYITRHDLVSIAIESKGSNMPTMRKRKATQDFIDANNI
jgi:ATP-dependent RNA helicase DDX24/MAK5